MEPMVLFGIQFSFCLIAYALIARWYGVARLSARPRELALVPLLWVHVFRIGGGTILAPGAVGAAVPEEFRTVVGVGDMATAVVALICLIALRAQFRGAIAMVWLFLALATLDTVNAVIQSLRYSVFSEPLGVNWVIVTLYVPALVVSSVLIFFQLRRPGVSVA